jgi:ATP-binding cassette subfamily B protein
MARSKIDFRGQAFAKVLRFAARHWRRQPTRIALIMALFFTETVADILTPFFAGRLVEAVASGAASNEIAWNAAVTAFLVIVALGVGSVIIRQLGFQQIIGLTLRMMSEITQSAFHRVQRFSSDWHANSFAGSTVRKITRGMWALDQLNDVILMALFPSLVMLVGTTVMLGLFWPVMGLVVGIGSIIYIAVTVTLSTTWVAPAASLANQWDTRMGGALADAISCNAVVKGFGAEDREESRLKLVVDKWRKRTSRTWNRGTLNGTIQNAMLLVLRASIIGAGLVLWQQGAVSAGDITFVITTFFVLQGYLRDIGSHVRNLQRAVNDMEELVNLDDQKLGIEDRAGAKPIAIKAGGIAFEHVEFHRAGRARRPRRTFGLGQDDVRQADPAAARCQRRSHRHRRRRHPRREAGLAAPADRHRATGAGAVPPLAGRQHRLWPAGRQSPADHRGGEARQRA